MAKEEPQLGGMYYGATPSLFEKARELRKSQTEAEKLLWKYLSGQKLNIKFRRQHPLNSFIADFYAHELRLVIEVDGGIHSGQEAKHYDAMRTKLLNEFSIDVIRFTNEEVLGSLGEVVEKIEEYMHDRRLQLGR